MGLPWKGPKTVETLDGRVFAGQEAAATVSMVIVWPEDGFSLEEATTIGVRRANNFLNDELLNSETDYTIEVEHRPGCKVVTIELTRHYYG